MTTGSDIRVNTTVQSLGKQRNSDGWHLVLEYKLPGSTYETNLYGKDWNQVSGHTVGDQVCATIRQGRLKDGKDPSKPYNYFYDLVSLTEPQDGLPAPAAAPQGPEPNPYREPLPEYLSEPEVLGRYTPPEDSVQRRIREGMAFNAAYTLISHGMIEQPTGSPLEELRQLRDRIFHEVIEVPIKPPHYCYTHEAECEYTARRGGDYFHEIAEGGWCLEQGGIVPPQEPEPTPKTPEAFLESGAGAEPEPALGGPLVDAEPERQEMNH